MKNNVDTLLTHVYEIEGLLLVMQRHQQEVPQLVIDRLKEAVNQLHDEAQLIENEPSPSTPVTEVAEQPAMPVTAQEPAPEPVKKEPAPAPEHVEAPKPVEAEETTAPAEPQEVTAPTVKAAEKQHKQHDVTAAFSINDRFLFLRELFDGNSQQFNDAIGVIQRMSNIDQVQQFVTDVLQLDSSNDIVKEFIRLINLSFKK